MIKVFLSTIDTTTTTAATTGDTFIALYYQQMKSIAIVFVMSLALVASMVASFVLPHPNVRSMSSSSTASSSSSTTSLYFFDAFSAPKDDGTPGDYVCKDCGYVYTKGPKAWAAESEDYSCPPCGAPKRRFKKVPKGSASGKVEVKKSWFGK